MIHGVAAGQFIDGKDFWPIFARAEKLDVPIYLHPALPHAAVTDAYFKQYVSDFPLVLRPAWGYTVETATQANLNADIMVMKSAAPFHIRDRM